MMWQIVLIGVCVSFPGAFLWERRKRKFMQSASDRKLENVNRLFDAILTHIHAYVLVIDSDFKVLKTNYYDLTHLNPDGKEKRVGDLLQCQNALSAKGGCGTHAFCQECPVRGAIGAAFRQKSEFTDLQSSLNIAIGEDEFIKCNVMISGVFMTLDGEDRMVLTVHDITSIKHTEEALAEAKEKAENADRSKSAFLANMSHEIRTPLNAIVGFSKLVIDAECTNEKEQYAEIIERNSEILLNLFNDILDLSSLEADSLSFNIRPIKLIDICLQLEQQFCYKVKNGTKLILDDVDTELYVSGDWNRIIQIISNLLSNAAKFTPKGEIHFGYREKEDFVEFYVKDSGIGIPAERVATIFQRFGKINDFVQGTGLGLTLCRMLVEKMGGRIWLRSQEGKGSRFYFTLPLIRQ